MKPDKFKKKDYFDTGRGDYRDDFRSKQPNPNNIQDEDERDELPSKAPSVTAYNGRHYSNALLRLLRSNIGKRWDDVYSILSEKLGKDKENIKWYVDQDAYKRADGVIVSLARWGEQEVRGFYVMNGILGEQRKSFKYKRDTSKIKATYVDRFVVFKDKNIYYKAPLEKGVPADTVWLYYSNTDYSKSDTWLVYSIYNKKKREKFAISTQHIRQLSSKELMRWDLPNTEINENLGLRFW